MKIQKLTIKNLKRMIAEVSADEKVDTTNFYSRDTEFGEACWYQETLWRAVKNLESRHVTLDFFSNEDIAAAYHNLNTPFELERIHIADLSYPIIVYDEEIIDGFHRLAKIIDNGLSTVEIVELDELPKPDFFQ